MTIGNSWMRHNSNQHKVTMRKLAAAIMLVLPAQIAGQLPKSVLAGDSVVACGRPPELYTKATRCIPVAKGTEIYVLGSMRNDWVKVGIGEKTYFVRREFLPVVPANSVCSDSLYQAFKRRPFNELTEREYQFLLERDRQCAEYQRTVLAIEPQKLALEETRAAVNNISTILYVSLVLSLAGGLIYYLAAGY